MEENDRVFQVDLTFTSDNDNDLRVLKNQIREETFPDQEGWSRLDLLLLYMGQCNVAQNVYEHQFDQTSIEINETVIYNQLGWVKSKQGKYEEAFWRC